MSVEPTISMPSDVMKNGDGAPPDRIVLMSRLRSQGSFRFWYPTHGEFTANGEEYKWDSRAHRKMRYPVGKGAHPEYFHNRIRFLGWEPRNVTWYICWLGVIANTLWVVNGIYATWPDTADNSDIAERTSFATGVVGAFLFIVTGYLGFVEAINHTYAEVTLPPIRTSKHPSVPVRKRLFQHLTHESWRGPLERDERHLCLDRVTDDNDEKNLQASGYRWWAWRPDLHQMGIFNSLVFFVSTIIFFIPASAWLPLSRNEYVSKASFVFWVQVLQVRHAKI
jgi:hypothetical protein